MKNILKKILILIFLSSFTSAFAADTTIEMLNKSGKEIMVYSNKIVSVNVGDTVFWKATSKGHNVEFIKGGTPEGVTKFKSKMNKDAEFKFEKPGIYAYWCTPHKMMGMIGFVVVGNDKSNLEAIKSIKFVGKSKKLASELFDQL
ncbi:pseudoazurin [Candidatus Pelagibacter sp.]|nr:pseudoazurin [Candidatus Pelagibacter sp.]